ncbi:hypothetical protein [Inquilinus sp. Marseille-Q2685]|uniref:hypothetical protein n=1 Tax=Inquilinus sp. Marseille-Q2685 TaxID=2866581 RepID=UPI001CE43510|nr:hypothetical protein [Inquilinus sp. Marseille-Q2685]
MRTCAKTCIAGFFAKQLQREQVDAHTILNSRSRPQPTVITFGSVIPIGAAAADGLVA